MTIAAGTIVAAASGASAAPLPGTAPVLTDGARLQTVQYYREDWRYREARRAELERRRHAEWVRWHRYHPG